MAPALPTPSQHSRNRLSQGAGDSSKQKYRPQRAASFHGAGTAPVERRPIRRPRTQPDLLAGSPRSHPESPRAEKTGDKTADVSVDRPATRRVPPKVLVNVTVQRSLGPVQVMASADWTVAELVAAAVRVYGKEGRRPLLPAPEPSACTLHYSQFSLECLDPKDKLVELGSRNFFLCPRPLPPASPDAPATTHAAAATASSSSCSKEAEKASKTGLAVEVKPGKTFKCDPRRDSYVYLTQASLGSSKKEGTENVQIFLKFGDLNLVIGTLSAEKWPQISYNLFFEKKFELSHNSKYASVSFFGQKTLPLGASDSDDDDDLSVSSASSDDNDVQVGQVANVVKHETRKPKQEEADEIVELEKPSYPKNLNASDYSSEGSFEECGSEESSSEGDSFGEYDSEEDSQLRNDSEDEEETDENESLAEDAAITSKLDNKIKRLSPREQSVLYPAVVQKRGSLPSKTSEKAKRSNAK